MCGHVARRFDVRVEIDAIVEYNFIVWSVDVTEGIGMTIERPKGYLPAGRRS